MPLRLREQRQLGALGGFSFMDLPGREGVPPPGPGEQPQTSISPAEGSAGPSPAVLVELCPPARPRAPGCRAVLPWRLRLGGDGGGELWDAGKAR